MTQTIAIILRFREDRADEFEDLFETRVLPMWKEFKGAGKFVAASLSAIVDGSKIEAGVRDYLLHVDVPSEKEHDEFDSQASFEEFLSLARPLQPEEPKVWIGETRFQV